MAIDTVIFDMDGLLIDSEPLWLQAGKQVMAQYGKQLTAAEYETTVGLRTQEWLVYWFNYFGLPHTTIASAEVQILSLVQEMIMQKGNAMQGVQHIVQFFLEKKFKLGLATSSPMALAQAVVQKLGLATHLQAITSAEHLQYGKPHPQVYLQCAEALGSEPENCLCFEDSFNGLIAAKAAKMKCIVVPAAHQLKDARWGAADLKISSLQNFNELLMNRL